MSLSLCWPYLTLLAVRAVYVPALRQAEVRFAASYALQLRASVLLAISAAAVRHTQSFPPFFVLLTLLAKHLQRADK